jgi:hypothetical protein
VKETTMPTPKKHVNAAARNRAYHKRKEEARRVELERKGLPPLPSVPTIPGEARWKKVLAEVAALLSMVIEEREVYFDDRSDEWRESEKADAFQERTDAVTDLLASVDDLVLSS